MREDIVRATDLIPKRKDFPQKLQSQGTKFTFSPMETFQKKVAGHVYMIKETLSQRFIHILF